MFYYLVTVTVQRRLEAGALTGLTEITVTRKISTFSWADAAKLATETVLDDVAALAGGRIGCQVTAVSIKAANS